MKGLSLTQPWASLVVAGAKRIETRSWKTTYAGWVAIHAAKGFPRDCRALCYEHPFRLLLQSGPLKLPRGAIVAAAVLTGCRRSEDVSPHISELERRCGDYSHGRFAWLFTNIMPLSDPIPWPGALGLWNVPLALEGEIRRQLAAST